MLLAWFLLLAALVGHAGLMAVAINTGHAQGFDSIWAERITKVAIVVVGALTVWATWHLAGRPWSEWPLALRLYSLPCLGVALIGLPVTTLLRRLGREPFGTLTRSRRIDIDPSAVAGRGHNAWMTRLPGSDSLRPELVEWRVELAGLPTACDGLTVLHLTDLHFSPAYSRAYFEAVADAVASEPADLVVFTGDLIDDDACLDWVVPVLSRLRGRLGQFAILGNHDQHFDTGRITAALEEAGFRVVDGSWTTVDAGGAVLAIGGTSAPWGPEIDLSARPAADFGLLLCHTPDHLYRVGRAGTVDLMLSGHNHGGQVRLPVVGPLVMPSKYSRRFDHGFFRHAGTLMYVGRGLAAKHPIRYGCPPEVTRFALHVPAEAGKAVGREAVGATSGRA